MIKTLAHICLLSRDLERTLDFYCGALELRRKFDFLKEGSLFGFYLEIDPGHYIEVFKDGSPASEAPQDRRITHFCLEVDDIDALRTRLISRGLEVTEKTMGGDSSWQIWCSDPDGVAIEFHQYTPQSSQLTGTNCIVTW